MKKMLIIIFVIFLSSSFFAQSRQNNMARMHNRMMRKHGKELRMLEQLKLIEYLKLDENQAVRFAARRNKYLSQQDSLLRIKRELTDSLSALIANHAGDRTYKKIVSQIFKTDKSLISNKKSFLKNLSDFLSQEQIAKIVVFENRFKKDIMRMMLKRRGGINPKDFPPPPEE